jgi:hypothetical protein
MGGLNGFNNQLLSFMGLVFETAGKETIGATAIPAYTLVTEPGNSYDIVFIITGFCISGTNAGASFNQNIKYKAKNIAGTASIVVYQTFGTLQNGDITSVGQSTVVIANNISLYINPDTTYGTTANTWSWGYYITIINN